MSEVEERARRYIRSTDIVLSHLMRASTLPLTNETKFVMDTAERYIKDAKHYLEKSDPSTALVSISYAEGLLDALRFLKLVDFRWLGPSGGKDA